MSDLNFSLSSNLTKTELEDILIATSEAGGSDLFVLGNGNIWLSINGQKEKLTERKIRNDEVENIVKQIYGSSAISIMGSKKPLNTEFEYTRDSNSSNFKIKKKKYRFRFNCVSCQRDGQKSMTVTLRTVPNVPPSVKDIGVEDDIIDVCRKADQGLVLVVGATGNGKSTLLASIIRDQLEDPEGHRNIVTIEDPVEFVYDTVESPNSFVTAIQVNRDLESFNAGVVNALRMAPSTILIGEARDYETISSAIEASTTGHVVFSTVHANSVVETFQRMISTYPTNLQNQAKNELVQALKIVVAQRLLRTVDGKRTAIREYLIFNKKIKDYITEHENIGVAVTEMLEKYGKPMLRDAKVKLEQGIISQETYERQLVNYESE